MKRVKLMALLCMFLIVFTPFAVADSLDWDEEEEDFDDQDTGESLYVRVSSYEPTILTSNLIEDNDVRVYAFLSGFTYGTLLGSDSNVEPLFGGIEIEKVKIKPANLETKDFVKGQPKYIKPNVVEMDSWLTGEGVGDFGTLGYLVISLKQIEKEEDIPEEFNLSFTAEIYFSEAERLYYLAQSSLVLPEDDDYDDWEEGLDQYGSNYWFFGGRGLVRATNIADNSVDLTVYSNKDLFWPIVGAPRPIAELSLDVGEESQYFDLGDLEEATLKNAEFRIRLDKVDDPQAERAKVEVNVDGAQYVTYVTEGMSLFPGSTLTVKDFYETRGGDYDSFVMYVKDSKGNQREIITYFGENEQGPLVNKEFMKMGTATGDYYSYNPAESNLASVPVSEVDSLFSKFGVSLDVSRVSTEFDPTNKYTIKDGDTLKEVLATVLPGGYFYIYEDGQLYIEKLGSSDLCNEVGFYDFTYFDGFSDQELKSTNVYRQLICNAVEQYKVVVEEYGEELLFEGGVEVSYENLGEERMGDLYLELAKTYNTQTEKRLANEKALYYYQRVIERESARADAAFQSEVEALTNEIYGGREYGDATFDDNGRNVYVRLIEVVQTPEEDLTSIMLTIDGSTDTYHLNDYVFAESQDEGSYKVNWKITGVSEDYLRVTKEYVGSRPSGYSAESQTIVEDSSITLSGSVVKLTDIKYKREAYITILPGSGENLYSESNFSVHIPIEKRAFELNPDKIDSKIEKYKKLHESLEKKSEWLNGVVDKWIKVCYGTFAVVTLMNSLKKSSSFEARDFAINGNNDNGWSAYCQDKENWGSEYNSYDSCMLGHAGDIQDDMDAYTEALKADAEHEGDYDWESSFTTGFTDYDECDGYLGGDLLMDADSKSKYNVYYEYIRSGDGSADGIDRAEEYQDEILGAYSSVNLETKRAACNNASSYMNQYSGVSEEEKEAAFKSIYDANLVGSVGSSVDLVDYDSLKQIANYEEKKDGKRSVYAVGTIYATNSNVFVYSVDGKKEVKQMEYSNLLNFFEEFRDDYPEKDTNDFIELDTDIKTVLTELDDEIPALKSSIEKDSNFGERAVQTKSGKNLYYSLSDDWVFVGDVDYNPGELRDDYASDAKIELHTSGEDNGKPFCVPYRDGEFVKAYEYDKLNYVSNFDVWNVGPDGHLCTGDDIRLYSQSVLDMNDALYTKYSSHVNSMLAKNFNDKIGECYPMLDMCFEVSTGKSHVESSGAVVGCYEVMDPKSCKMLFAVCDPVMCPPSRFNLGGKWNVDSVVETGLIGSIMLPQKSGDPFPVCLTGINAGLNSWASQVEAMVECLETAKYDGEYVGVCDAIRSVYWCELAVRELVAIIDSNGGALNFLNGKLNEDRAEKGGGEYFSFEDSMQNMKDSVNYFTSEYSTSAFAAFRGRSLTEVGGDICKSAIYSKVPGFGDFFDKISQPEDPTTFTAHLTVRPYSETLGQEAYQAFYHIYAGLNENIDRVVYSVYLRNSVTGDTYPVTGQCGHSGGTIEQGGYVDETIDCVWDEDMDQICVMVNGETNCGFGSVSTSFLHDSVEQMLVLDEVERNITSEKDCYPEYNVATPTLSSVGTFGLSDSAILPYDVGSLSTGMKRVCSVEDPGKGVVEGSWTKVGTCGYDDEDRFLGYCWLDQDSMTIYDAEKREETAAYLEDLDWDITKISIGLDEYFDEEKSEEYYGELIDAHNGIIVYVEGSGGGSGVCSMILNMVDSWENFEDQTLVYAYSAVARYRRAEMIELLREGCGVELRQGVDYKIIQNTADVTNDGPTYVVEAGTAFTFSVSDLVDGDVVTFNGVKQTNPSAGWTYTFNGEEQTVELEVKDYLGETILSTSFTFTSNEEEQRQMCSACDDSLIPGYCKEQTCHDLDYCYVEGAYTTKSSWGYTVTNFISDTSDAWNCLSCYDADECSDYNYDKTMCNSILCTDKADLECHYDDDQGACLPGSSSSSNDDIIVTYSSLAELMVSLAEDNTEVDGRTCTCGDNCEEYAEYITKYAGENGVEPLLVLSLMMQESSCKYSSASTSAAHGLMQITQTAFDECETGDDSDTLSDIQGEANVEKNIQCGITYLTKSYGYYSGGKTFSGACTDEYKNVKYTGWDAAVRGYNGWGCNPAYPRQDKYVDEINERYDTLKGMLGQIDDSAVTEYSVSSYAKLEYANLASKSLSEVCEYAESKYRFSNSKDCSSVSTKDDLDDWSINFIEFILSQAQVTYSNSNSEADLFANSYQSTSTDAVSYYFSEKEDYGVGDLVCGPTGITSSTISIREIDCYFIVDDSSDYDLIGNKDGEMVKLNVDKTTLENDYFGYISFGGVFDATDNEQRLADAIVYLGGKNPDRGVYDPSCCGAWSSAIYKYMGYNYVYGNNPSYETVQELVDDYNPPVAFNIYRDSDHPSYRISKTHSLIYVAEGDDAQKWLDEFVQINLYNSESTLLTGSLRKVDDDEVLLISFDGRSTVNFAVLSKTNDPKFTINQVFPLYDLCNYYYQPCPSSGSVSMGSATYSCDSDDFYWSGDGTGDMTDPWSKFWEPVSPYYPEGGDCS